jgi:tagatose 1,6-diphosphate aldolase
LTVASGKQRGLRALCDERGVIAALAIDQRDALRKLFAKATGLPTDKVPAQKISEFKEHVSRILTPYASAILLDPEYGLPAAAKRDSRAGLLLAYEQTGYDRAVPGRLPRLLDGFSVARLKEEGADGVKVLLYYSPFSTNSINVTKQEWVEHVGAECLAADVPFFLELVSYHDELDEKSPEFARIKPEAVTRSVEEFCHPRYAVDVLKVGIPVNMRFVQSPLVPRGQALYTRAEARAYFQHASQAASLPFIYLSEGVSNDVFADALAIAAEAGSAFSGVLCGRATWQDGVAVFAELGSGALQEWLQTQGVRNIRNINACLAGARPCFANAPIQS